MAVAGCGSRKGSGGVGPWQISESSTLDAHGTQGDDRIASRSRLDDGLTAGPSGDALCSCLTE